MKFPDVAGLIEAGIKLSPVDEETGLRSIRWGIVGSHPHKDKCRGMVIDENDNIVAYPFDKFYNFHQSQAATIDWENAWVYEKMDGTMCTLYWYKDKWRVATTGTPTGSGQAFHIADREMTFAELFWDTWEKCGYTLDKLDRTRGACNYMFELIGPENTHVVEYDNPELVLLGYRMLDDGFREFCFSEGAFRSPDRFKATNLQSLVAETNSWDETANREGFVVVDKDLNRVKVKSAAYIKLHTEASQSPFKRFCFFLDNIDDFSPELVPEDFKVSSDFFAYIEAVYKEYEDISDNKTFALTIKDLDCKTWLFWRRQGRDLMQQLIIGSNKLKKEVFEWT